MEMYMACVAAGNLCQQCGCIQRLFQRAEALEAKLSQAEAEAQAKEEQLTQQLQAPTSLVLLLLHSS